ncbi:MAG: hypothetical protein V3S69_02750 [Dehalococcoidales bacterium]
MEDILNNKYFLYLVAFISFTNVLGYLSMGNVESVLIFGATTALTGYFSKNWIVRLLAALVVTNVVFANYMIREGFKEGLSAPGKTSDVDREGDEEAKDEEDENFEAATEEEEREETGKGRIDYAATMEQAYDNLNNMLGEKGMGNLSNDTQNLVKKQKDLMNQIEKMKPILEGAQGVLEGLDMSKIEGMMDTFTGLMSKLR